MKFSSHVSLSHEVREELIEMLNRQLASAIDLHWQVKQAHWNVRGPHFYSRHELFDGLAKHVRGHADDFAERAGALGGYARGTIRLAARFSELEEYDLTAVSGEEHLRALVERTSRYAASLRQCIQRSEDLGDPVTEDLFTRLLAEVEQDLWFLESHLYGGIRMGREESAPHEIREEILPPPSA